MNNTLFPELQTLRIELSDEVRDAQFAAIVTALEVAPEHVESPLQRAKSTWRRWAVTAAALSTALVPVAAVASESAVPGDLLYPIKRTVERVQLIFDRDIDAEHRVDELERMVVDSPDVDVVEAHLAETLAVLDATSDRADLVDRVDDAIERFRQSDRIAPASDQAPAEPTRREEQSDVVSTTSPADRPTEAPTDRTEPVSDEPVTTPSTNPSDQSDVTTTTRASDGRDTGDGDAAEGNGDRGDSP